MGDTIEQYRQKIGLFSSNNFKSKKNKLTTKYSDNCGNIRLLMSALLCIYVSIFILSNNSFSPSPVNMMMNTPTMPMATPFMNTPSTPMFCLLCVKTLDAFINYPIGISGYSANKTNQVCHSLNGNRRNIGYTYLAWNCDKGFLAQKKLDDIKVAVDRHKSLVIGVSEVNFKRNEFNQNEASITCLSTEQLYKKLQIPEYGFFLTVGKDIPLLELSFMSKMTLK